MPGDRCVLGVKLLIGGGVRMRHRGRRWHRSHRWCWHRSRSRRRCRSKSSSWCRSGRWLHHTRPQRLLHSAAIAKLVPPMACSSSLPASDLGSQCSHGSDELVQPCCCVNVNSDPPSSRQKMAQQRAEGRTISPASLTEVCSNLEMFDRRRIEPFHQLRAWRPVHVLSSCYNEAVICTAILNVY